MVSFNAYTPTHAKTKEILFQEFLILGWDGINNAHLPAFSYNIIKSLLSLVPHLPRATALVSELHEHASSKNLARVARDREPRRSATEAKRRIFNGLLVLIAHHNCWSEKSDKSRWVDPSLLGTLDGTCQVLLQLSGRPSTDARKVLLFWSGGWKTINSRPPAGFSHGTLDSLIGLVPHLNEDTLRKDLNQIIKNVKAVNAVRQSGARNTSAIRQLFDSLYLLVCRHNDWAKTRATSLYIDPNLLLSEEGTYKILQIFRLAASGESLNSVLSGAAGSTMKKRILRKPPEDPEAFFIQSGWEVLEKAGLKGFSVDTVGALLVLGSHLRISAQQSLRRNLEKTIKIKNCGEVARQGESISERFDARKQIFRGFHKIILFHNEFVKAGEPDRIVATDMLLSKSGLRLALSRISFRPSFNSRKFNGFASGGLKAINVQKFVPAGASFVDSFMQLVPHLQDSHSLRFELARIFLESMDANRGELSELPEIQRQIYDAFCALIRGHNHWASNSEQRYRISYHLLQSKEGMNKLLATFHKCSKKSSGKKAA